MTVNNMMDEWGIGSPNETNQAVGSYPTILKFNANTGQFSLREVDSAGETQWNSVEFPKQVAIDMPNFRKGWNLLRKGTAPDQVLVHYTEAMPAQPSEEHKPTFEVKLYSKHLDYCVFSSNSLLVCRMMQGLLNEHESKKPQAPHMVPIVSMQLETISTANGDFQVPKFSIEKYVARPNELIEPVAPTKKEASVKPKSNGMASAPPEFDDSLDSLDAQVGEADEF